MGSSRVARSARNCEDMTDGCRERRKRKKEAPRREQLRSERRETRQRCDDEGAGPAGAVNERVKGRSVTSARKAACRCASAVIRCVL